MIILRVCLNPLTPLSLELFHQHFFDQFGIALALGGLHGPADEKSHGLLDAVAVIIHCRGISRQDLIDNLFDLARIGNLPETELFDDLRRRLITLEEVTMTSFAALALISFFSSMASRPAKRRA